MTGGKLAGCGKTLLRGAFLESPEPSSVGFIVDEALHSHLRSILKR